MFSVLRTSFITKNTVALGFILLSCNISIAQSAAPFIPHSPHKAAMFSAIIPGGGQIYNRKFWKVPVIYAGFAGLGYAIKFNNDEYITFKKAYGERLDGNPETIDNYANIYSDNDLLTLKDYYRRNRDLSIIGCGLLYILNIVDATVDAHLFSFDVSDNLSFQWSPSASPRFNSVGLSLTFEIHHL